MVTVPQPSPLSLSIFLYNFLGICHLLLLLAMILFALVHSKLPEKKAHVSSLYMEVGKNSVLYTIGAQETFLCWYATGI